MTQESDNSREVVATETRNMTENGQVTFSKKRRPEDAESVRMTWYDDGTVDIEFLKTVPVDSESVVARGGDEQ